LEGRHTRERKKIAPISENPAPPRMEAVAPVKSRVPFCRSTMPCMTWDHNFRYYQAGSREPDTIDFSCRIDY